MVRVYALRLDNKWNDLCYHRLMAAATPATREKVNAFLRREDGCRSLFAEFLVRYALVRDAGMKMEDIVFGIHEQGKPYLTGSDHLHFNISHSGDWVVCALDSQPVGVDIEQILPADISTYKHHFSSTEYEELCLHMGTARQNYFYDLWTLKESYIKQRGGGMFIPLASFTIHLQPDSTIFVTDSNECGNAPYFRQYNVDERYKMAVCAISSLPENVEVISLVQLMQFL